jgi:chloride channel 2
VDQIGNEARIIMHTFRIGMWRICMRKCRLIWGLRLCSFDIIVLVLYFVCCGIWHGMLWYIMLWHGVLCSGFVRYGMIWYGMVWYGMIWYDMVWYGMIWYDMIWYGMVWYGMVWYGMVWYGMVWYGMCGMVYCIICCGIIVWHCMILYVLFKTRVGVFYHI